MPAFARAEIWSDLQAAGGQRLAVIPDVVQLAETRRVTGEDQLTATLPVRSPAWAAVRAQRVLRLVFVDGSVDEWRIATPADERGDRGLLSQLTCRAVLADLARTVVSRTEADGSVWYEFEALQLTPAQHLASFILPALATDGFTWFAAGTIDPTLPVDLAWSSTSALAGLQALAKAAGAELQLRRNGTTQYLIDLVTHIGSAAAPRRVRLGRDLTGVRRTYSTDEQATRVIPRGTAEDGLRPTMARARWQVTAIAGALVTLADPDGGDGPIAYDDQLNGCYLRKADGSLTQIVDTLVATQQLQVASAASVTVGDRLEVRRTNTGEDLTYLEAPSERATYGLHAKPLDRPDLPATLNLLPNAALATWAAGLPVGYTALGGAVVTEVTTPGRWRTGGRAARLQTAVDGAGLVCTAVAVAPSAAAPYGSAYVSFYLASGRVRVELLASDGTTVTVLPDGINGKAFSTQTGQWIDLGVAGIDLHALGATSCQLRIVQDGPGTADVYVDALQLTRSASQQPFLVGSGPNQLWQAANRTLRANAAPLVTVDVDLLDLERMNRALFGTEPLVLGGTVRVEDAALGVDVTARIVELTRTHLANGAASPTDARLVLSTRLADLADELADPGRTTRQDPTVLTGDLPTTSVSAARTAQDGATVTYEVTGAAATGIPQVRLAALVGATLNAGAAVGALVASGADWTFDRPAADQPEGQATFEAVLDGYVTASIVMPIAPQSVGTLRLGCAAVVQSTNATQQVVRVTATDPVVQNGTAYLMLTPSAPGCTVAPATPQAVVAGGYVDFTVTRPTYRSGTGQFHCVASAANRESTPVDVDVPAQEASVPLTIKVVQQSSTDSQVVYRVAVADPYPQGFNTITLYKREGTGSETSVGGTGTPTSDLATTGYLDVTVNRPATGTPLTVVFRAAASGRLDAAAGVDVPAAVPVSPSLSAPFGLADAAADTLTVTWTASNFPVGTTFNLDWSVDGGASGRKADTASGVVINTPLNAGASGSLVLTALMPDGTTRQRSSSGVFAT